MVGDELRISLARVIPGVVKLVARVVEAVDLIIRYGGTDNRIGRNEVRDHGIGGRQAVALEAVVVAIRLMLVDLPFTTAPIVCQSAHGL